ncbi:hypothetical protein WA026_003693 [Henosepilachna vigintioctopunctata]|uniref:Chitin-binding type-2 domain-containing protein n=1 Tax=Henosepilachna vigintioctopunctata TaxID=420089 RepID=A0AAW1U8I9_9CUCU
MNLFTGLFLLSSGISIEIKSKPQRILPSSFEASTAINLRKDSDKSTFADRQKPSQTYVDYYVAQNVSAENADNAKLKRYSVYEFKRLNPDVRPSYNYGYPVEARTMLTPFLKTNALPGTFSPVVRKQKPQPDFSAIYGKLWILKSRQERLPAYTRVHHAPEKYYVQKHHHPFRQTLQKEKIFIETSPPTNLDIPPILVEGMHANHFNSRTTESYKNPNSVNTFISKQVVIDLPPNAYVRQHKEPISYQRPIDSLQKAPIYYPEEQLPRSVILAQSRPIKEDKQRTYPIVEENYVAQKYIIHPKLQDLKQQAFSRPEIHPQDYYKYESVHLIQPSTPSLPKLTENVNIDHSLKNDNRDSLSDILKKLQNSNALPLSLTADNIDNSIKTLVKILDSLKKQRKILKPIVVVAKNEDQNRSHVGTLNFKVKQSEHIEDILGPSESEPTLLEANDYPEDTQEGGTPGMPGVDYPALNTIPSTSFNCKTQRYKGFFADPDTHCQVWHYCDLNGGQASFLCPNGTIFSQVALTCDWWYNVKCSLTPQLYVLNERLYKYILPFAPKFPEDYTGPLVDKYLALKFMEMEEKLKRERKGKEETTDETTSMDELTEPTTIAQTKMNKLEI